MAEAEHAETPAERARRELDENEIRNGQRVWSHEETGEPWRNPDSILYNDDQTGEVDVDFDDASELDAEVAE